MPYGNLHEFDLHGSLNWDAYIRLVGQFILLNDIKSELSVATLVTHVGAAIYELMCDLCSPDYPESKQFQVLVDLVKNHLDLQSESKLLRGRVANGAASPAESPRRRGRPKQEDTDYFTAFYNKAQELKYNVAVQIFQYLGMRDLAHCARVCRLWRDLAATPQLWRHVRMKNSHVSDWGGLFAALRRHGTRRLDLRKMLLPQNDSAFWDQFAEHVHGLDQLERIEMCRCPASAVEAVCRGVSNLRSLSALAIRSALLDPAPLGALTQLHELRLKSMAGLSLTRDLQPLATLTGLTHLSLTSIKELGWCACDVVGELPQLESLELGECSFRAEFALVLGKLSRLRRLRLERGTAQCAAPALLRALALLPALTSLELVNFDVKVTTHPDTLELAVLGELWRLRRLRLERGTAQCAAPALLRALALLPALTSLELVNFDVKVTTHPDTLELAVLGELWRLRRLRLERGTAQCAAPALLRALALLPALTSLELVNFDVKVTTHPDTLELAVLGELWRLRRLRLERGTAQCAAPALLRALALLPALTSLELVNFDVKVTTHPDTLELAVLGELWRLRRLRLERGTAQCAAPALLPALTSLELVNFDVKVTTHPDTLELAVLGELWRLRRLRLERGTAQCAAPALLRALALLPALTSLELVNFDVKVTTHPDTLELAVLGELWRLRRLRLERGTAQCAAPALLRALALLPALTSLELVNFDVKVTTHPDTLELAVLGELWRLRRLRLERGTAQCAAPALLRALALLPALTSLELVNFDVKVTTHPDTLELAVLGELWRLRRLRLERGTAQCAAPALLRALALLPALTSLELVNFDVKVTTHPDTLELAVLGELWRLRRLRLERGTAQCAAPALLRALALLPALTSLELVNFDVKVTTHPDTLELAVLGELWRLRRLRLERGTAQCAAPALLRALALLPALTSLELVNFDVKVTTHPDTLELAVLGELWRLRRLRLERGTAQCAAPALLRALALLPALTSLELVNFDVKVGFDDALAECKNIQRLLIIPTYVSQSATTNKQVLSGVLRLKDTLTHLMWGVTIELLRVTELFIDQCEQGAEKRRDVGECIPVLKPVPGCRLPQPEPGKPEQRTPPQVEILPLPTLQRLLAAQLPNTKLKLLRIPFHATWRQSLADFQ